MGKLAFKHEMSLRAKFNDENTIVVMVSDHTTKEEFSYVIPFRTDVVASLKSVSHNKSAKSSSTTDEVSNDDKDSD